MVIIATASWYSASNSSSEASFTSRTGSSSSPSSRASTTWAECAPDCFQCKGTPPRKVPARGIAVSMASLSGSYSYRFMAALTICDCFSNDNLAFQEHVCLNQRIHLSSHCFEASQQNVESRVLITDFLTWLTFEIVDEVVCNPSSS